VSRSALVIVPTYNERANLPVLVDSVMQHTDVRLMVVDDQSPDGTGALADELAAAHPGRIEVMHRTGRRGLGRSYIDGIKKAIIEPVDVICQMDADLSHNPEQLPSLIAATADADVVIGSRYIPGGSIVNWPKRRQVLSRFANIYIRAVTRMKTRDCTSGYRCWRRTALAGLPLDRFVSDGYSFLVEMLFVASRRGCRIAEMPIRFVERREGESKISRAVLLESALTPWRLIGNPDLTQKAPPPSRDHATSRRPAMEGANASEGPHRTGTTGEGPLE
jgi:dolichol-phosphate mannosyltransferase